LINVVGSVLVDEVDNSSHEAHVLANQEGGVASADDFVMLAVVAFLETSSVSISLIAKWVCLGNEEG